MGAPDTSLGLIKVMVPTIRNQLQQQRNGTKVNAQAFIFFLKEGHPLALLYAAFGAVYSPALLLAHLKNENTRCAPCDFSPIDHRELFRLCRLDYSGILDVHPLLQ
ncbi:uncharacterized protein PHALS_12041 [Plasmopara halstedii]|uniref:Uncharacterized protein n=1 Tax=Plasmopara halstedii TaxID=4781 RepID=A0A0P1AL91_PLAHL|nr:uncharacterized protein PHALS_12041 [Plasmopara halstedii]CEG41710.1 hypothetical protein PHALS_12041 [Plasmopara halstedii]|eukprot:XP_024578079.1 hypothetical protein PHALS_12041 [Plasmopara halstedii]